MKNPVLGSAGAGTRGTKPFRDFLLHSM